jgi:zinc protease
MALELQKLGASISVNSGLIGVTFTVQALKKNLDAVLNLLAERLYNPKFTEEAFTRIKKQRLESFKLAKSQPAAVADAVFAKVNYGANHILGTSQNGTEETTENTTLADIENYYTRYMTSKGAKLVVVGDIKQAEVLSKLGFLNKLPAKTITIPNVDPAPAVAKTKVYMVDVPKGAQTEFRVGYATGLKWDAFGDYYKANLANYALGGDFNSRLNLKLREDKGWTYGAGSGFSGNEIGGEFRFASGIRGDATDSALAEVMSDVKAYLQTGPTAEELTFAKSALGQYEALRYETPGQKALFIRRILDYKLPANYMEQQSKVLKTITASELKRVAGKYIQPDKLNILLVGDKEKIAPGVKKLGYDIVELDTDGKPVETKKAF